MEIETQNQTQTEMVPATGAGTGGWKKVEDWEEKQEQHRMAVDVEGSSDLVRAKWEELWGQALIR